MSWSLPRRCTVTSRWWTRRDSKTCDAKGNLKGKSYMDKEIDAKNPPLMTYDKDRVTFGTKLVDSIFLNTDPEVLYVGNGASGGVENTTGGGPRDLESTKTLSAINNSRAWKMRAR